MSERDVEKAGGRLAEAREELAQNVSVIAQLERDKIAAAEDVSAFANIDGKLQAARADRERLLLVVRRRENEHADAERGLADETARAELDSAIQTLKRASAAHRRAAEKVLPVINDGWFLQLRAARERVVDAEARVRELLPDDAELELGVEDEPTWIHFEEAAQIVAEGPFQPHRDAADSAARSDREGTKQDEQLITWAVRQALGFPVTSVEGREAIEAVLSNVRADLQAKARRRYDAEVEKRRGKIPLGAGALREMNPVR